MDYSKQEAKVMFDKTSNRWYVLQGKKQIAWYLAGSIAFMKMEQINSNL